MEAKNPEAKNPEAKNPEANRRDVTQSAALLSVGALAGSGISPVNATSSACQGQPVWTGGRDRLSRELARSLAHPFLGPDLVSEAAMIFSVVRTPSRKG